MSDTEYRRRDGILDGVQQEYETPFKLRARDDNTHQRWGPVTEHTPQRNTDYDFPELWYRMSTEEKIRWFRKQRSYRQAWRQWDAGAMMQGFDRQEISGGLSTADAWDKASENPYRYDN